MLKLSPDNNTFNSLKQRTHLTVSTVFFVVFFLIHGRQCMLPLCLDRPKPFHSESQMCLMRAQTTISTTFKKC